MTYDIEISERAYSDLESVIDFLKVQSRPSAHRWYVRIRNAFVSLQRFPARCSLATDLGLPGRTIRQLFHGKRPHVYRILFEVRAQTVFILRVVHGKQDQLNPADL